MVSRVFHKSTGVVRGMTMENDENEQQVDSFVDNLIHSPSAPGTTTTTTTVMLPALRDLSPDANQQDFKPVIMAPSSSSHGKSPYFSMAYKMLHTHGYQILPPDYKFGFVNHAAASGSANPAVAAAGGSVLYPQHLLVPNPPTMGGSAGNGLFYSAFMPDGGTSVDLDNAVVAKQVLVNSPALKMEQTSYNNVSGSQETGLSMEVAANTETTSALSKAKQIADDQSSPRPFDDLDTDPSYHDGDMDDDLDPYSFWDDIHEEI